MFPVFSTHALPIQIFCGYPAKTTKAKIALLLIAPKKADFGEGLTLEVEASTQKIVSVLLEVLP